MNINTWQENSREVVFQKYGRKVEKVLFTLPNGEVSDFYIQATGEVVCVLALTTEQEVLLVKQFRPGPQQVLLELPGGGIDKGESPTEAIARELLEETGYVGDVQYVGQSLDDAYSTLVRHVFVAANCRKVAEVQQTSTEVVEVVIMSLAEFRGHLRSGQLTDIEVGYLGLDFLGLLQ